MSRESSSIGPLQGLDDLDHDSAEYAENWPEIYLNLRQSDVLMRRPDIQCEMSKAERYTSVGNANGWIRFPAAFTPCAPVPTFVSP